MTGLSRIAVFGFLVVLTSATGVFADSFGPLSLQDVDGRPTSLADERGRVVLLNFWATWCKPCVVELPLLADLAVRHREDGLVVVAASVDEADARAEVESVAAGLPAAMQVWVGATLGDMERLGVGGALPVTVLLDRTGAVARLHHGPLESGDLDDEIATLLEPGPTPNEETDSPDWPESETAEAEKAEKAAETAQAAEEEAAETEPGAVASRVPS